MNRKLWALMPFVLMAGCSPPSDTEETATPTPSPAATPPPAASAAPPAAVIPSELQGRWGLVAADCDPARDDAKGLMEVAANTLTFYESRARLGAVRAAGPDRIRATFAFSGEGQEWTSDVELRSWERGAKLIREDRGPDAAGPLTYMRCPA